MVEDLHNFGADYELTLRTWEENFDAGWFQLKEKYGQQFYRMWKTYLQLAQGMLGSRSFHLYQIVFSKNGILGGYHAPR